MKTKMKKEEIIQFKNNLLYKRIISNARAIISNNIVLVRGVKKMLNLLYNMSDYKSFESDMEVFRIYNNSTTGIPIGTERLYWNIETLKKEDKRLRELDELYKDEILQVCYDLIKKYESENRED